MTIESDALKKVDNDYRKLVLGDLDTRIRASELEYRDGISGLKDFFENLDTNRDNVLINTMMHLIRPINSNCSVNSSYKILNNLYETIKMIDKRGEINQLTQEKNQLQKERESLTQKNTSLLSEKDSLSSQLDKLTEQSKTLCEEFDGAQFVMDGTRHDCMSII